MSALHDAHVRVMVLSAMNPLRQGVNLTSVMQVMGSMTAMYMLSPQVREVVGDYRPRIVKGLKEKIQDRRSSKLDTKAMHKLDRAEERGGGRDALSARWQRRLDKMEGAKPGDRQPYTAQSAALVEVGLAESAYAAMRDPSVPAERLAAHRADIMNSYSSAMEVLGEYVQEDGLERQEVDQAVRVLVGQRMAAEPELASVFTELAHGRFVRAEPREVYLPGATRPSQVWTGAFTDAVTDVDVDKGSFSLRVPGSRAEHLDRCTTTLEAELEDATTLEELNEMFASYTAASVVRQYPDMVAEVQDPSTRSRMTRAAAMFTSMRADGVSPSDQRFIYGAAFVDAMERVSTTNPDLMAQWEAQFGPDWQEGVQDVVGQYSELGTRVENQVLIDALVARGYAVHEASLEVAALREQREQAGEQGPLLELDPEQEMGLDSVEEPSGFEAATPPSGVSAPVALLDQMSQWVADDVSHQLDRVGWRVEETGEILAEPGDGSESYVAAEHFLKATMADYSRASDLPDEAGSFDQLDPTATRRRQSVAEMYEAMDAEGIPLATQDAMMAAAYVSGLERVVARQPFHALQVENSVLDTGGEPQNWREHLYTTTLERAQASRRAHDPDHRGFSARLSPEQVAQRAASGSEGYAVWEREFDRLDEVDVVGQAKVGELSAPGPDTVRDEVSAQVNTLGNAVSESEQQRRAVLRRSVQRKAVRKNLAYNEHGRTEGPMGLGRDTVRVLQDGDDTPGRSMDADPEPQLGG